MTAEQPMVRLTGVAKRFTKGKETISIFDHLDLAIPRGDFIAVMGPSGSGKTTLLNLLGGIDRADAGEIAVADQRIDGLSEGELAAWRAANIGFIFQFYNLMPMLTAAQNVELPLLLTRLKPKERAERVQTALSVVGLADRIKHRPREMSGGQQQRVAIARAIVSDPNLLLCDEPTGDLDRQSADEILSILQLLNGELGKTIVMVTHDPAAANYAKRVAASRQGPVRRTGACRVNDFDLVRKNLFRRKLRASLMIVSILIAFMIFGVLAGFYRAFTAGEDRAAADRMITVNKINFTQPMPIAYFNRVRAVEGVRQVTFANWFGGYYQDPKNFVMALAIEPSTYFDVYRSEFDVPPDQLQAFTRDRGSAVVGEKLAQKWGWKIGDRIPIQSNIFSQKSGGHTWDLTIAGIVKGKAEHVDTNFLLFQYPYFDETRSFGKDTIGWMILQTTSPENNDRVAKAIDAMFANSTAETSTDTEKAFGKAFAAQFGNIALIVLLVVGAAFVTILMIVGNTMALSIRERTREIGVLKTLGFSGPRILAMVLGESVLLALLGGIPGLAIAALIAMALRASLSNIAPAFAVSPTIALQGVALMIALGLITGIIPALNAMRLKIATALGRG